MGHPGTESGQALSCDPTTSLATERDALAFFYIHVHVNSSKLSLEKHLRSKDNYSLLPHRKNFHETKHLEEDHIMQQKIKVAGVSRRTIFRVRTELKEIGTLTSYVSTKIQ